MAGKSNLMSEVLRQLQAKSGVIPGATGAGPEASKAEKEKAAKAGMVGQKGASPLRINLEKLLAKRASLVRPGTPATGPLAPPSAFVRPGTPATGPSAPSGLPAPGGNYGMPAPSARGPATAPGGIPIPGQNYGMPTPSSVPVPTPGGNYGMPGVPMPPTQPGAIPAGAKGAKFGPQPQAPAPKPPSVPSGGGVQAPPSVTPAGGLTIGVEMRPPHTNTRGGNAHGKGGKPCRTDRWFDRAGLVYDASQPDDGPMGYNNPRLFLAGTTFRCYYPNSSRADFAAIMSSGSSGRWLHRWPEKSNYTTF